MQLSEMVNNSAGKLVRIDRSAIRFGEQAVGWIVILEHWRPDDGEIGSVAIVNTLYATVEDAIARTSLVNNGYGIVVKALRAAK